MQYSSSKVQDVPNAGSTADEPSEEMEVKDVDNVLTMTKSQEKEIEVIPQEEQIDEKQNSQEPPSTRQVLLGMLLLTADLGALYSTWIADARTPETD